MPINYDEIIKKAEARRAALQEYADAVAKFNDSMKALADVFMAAATLRATTKDLDGEAKELLDPFAVSRVDMYAAEIIGLHGLLDKVPYSGDSKTYRMFIEQLLDSVK